MIKNAPFNSSGYENNLYTDMIFFKKKVDQVLQKYLDISLGKNLTNIVYGIYTGKSMSLSESDILGNIIWYAGGAMPEDISASHGAARTLIVPQSKAAVADLITECRNLIIDFERKHDEFFLNFTKDTGMQNERPQEAPPVSYPSGGRQNYVQIPLSAKPVFDIIADTLYGADLGI